MVPKTLMNLKTKTLAQYYFAKALVLCTLSAASSDSYSLWEDVKSKILENFNKALNLYINLGCLEEIREIYYLQARIFNDFELYKYREMTASLYAIADNLIHTFTNSNAISKFSLPFERLAKCQEDTQKLLSTKLKVISFSF
jgi:isocitrate/isopropylmalate dehydrogenase